MIREVWSHTVTAAIVVASICCLIVGRSADREMIGYASCAVGLCFFALRASLFRARDVKAPMLEPEPPPKVDRRPRVNAALTETGGDETASLVHEMLLQGRYALLLRPQIAETLSPQQLQRARAALDEAMTVVPGGDVMTAIGGELPRQRVTVDGLYLDRYPITNRQFLEFVVQGGYEQTSLWDPTILPAVLDFVDQSGQPGPRYWENGEFRSGMEDHPVTGVSWFEACAYARWAGKRLPTDAEWIKAGAWPVPTSEDVLNQRRFPWGDTMDRRRVNVWNTGANTTCSVYELSEGVSVGGACHLIGNVWEWTTNNFIAHDSEGRRLELPMPMKSIRGGAFDTYFDTQASCQFNSGDSPIARKHNIGFRCAIGNCDVTPLLNVPIDNDLLADPDQEAYDLEPAS